ncbi:hypothetical protein [Mucilaginibacter sp. PPCGB 2223]|uniref:hypothetical protein n=1 Tax=Mucilaginibacter sp. PPCGB 2223 TaxID=1886027 RepID=UPI001586621F|nr:hypothetical protein [Mucilaginibacter sp. PPCGB 2223]
MKAFFSSINVSPELTTADQYITAPSHFPVVTVIVSAGILLIITGAVVFFRRRPNLAT